MKRLTYLVLLVCMVFVLGACQQKTSKPKAMKDPLASLNKTENLDFRLAFNKIKVTSNQTDFSGGSSLADLETLLGKPDKQEQKPAGEGVTLDVYTWTKGYSSITVHLFKDSTIARSIANFRFDREGSITKADFDKLTNGMSFTKVSELLGEPDVMSQVTSSDKAEIQAGWSSGIKTDSKSPVIELTFQNDQLVEKKNNDIVFKK